MHGHSIKETRHNIMVGTLSIYLILAVSLGASLAYWYLLAGISTTDTTDTFWLFMLWLVVAVGLVAELIKKITLSTFRNPTIWGVATFVSVLTVMGTYSILDNQKQSALLKQSDGYQMAKQQKADALNQQAKFAYAANFDLAALEQRKRVAGSKAYWGTFNRLKTDIAAKKHYDSAVATLGLASASMDNGTAGSVSSNPLLSTVAGLFGVSAALLKSVFYLLVTLLLEVAAYWIGGQVQQLKQRLYLTEAERLDLRNKAVFGVSMQDVNRALFDSAHQQRPTGKTPENAPPSSRSFSLGFTPHSEPVSEPKTGQSDPKWVQRGEPKTVHKQGVRSASSTRVVGSRRKAVTPDTGITGETANRYRAVKKAVAAGQIQPTKRGIKGFKFGGFGMGDTTAKKYRDALKKEGIIR